jgi:hypothetical protein
MSKIQKSRLEAIEGGKNLIGSFKLTENYQWIAQDGRAVIIASRPLKSNGSPTFLLYVDKFGLRHYIASLEASTNGKGFEFQYYGDRYALNPSKNQCITIGFLSQKVRQKERKKELSSVNSYRNQIDYKSKLIGRVKRNRNGYLTLDK